MPNSDRQKTETKFRRGKKLPGSYVASLAQFPPCDRQAENRRQNLCACVSLPAHFVELPFHMVVAQGHFALAVVPKWNGGPPAQVFISQQPKPERLINTNAHQVRASEQVVSTQAPMAYASPQTAPGPAARLQEVQKAAQL